MPELIKTYKPINSIPVKTTAASAARSA